VARAKGVEEILHFTTDKGIMGSLRKEALLSRAQVQDDPDLAFIFLGVWPVKAREWVDYVSLSVHSINLDLWERAVRNLPDRWWGVLAFDPAILDHDGVYFATTNNIYPACRRGQGTASFEALYGDPVLGRYSYPHDRDGLAEAQPTDRAAEVLYPTALRLEFLRCVYIATTEHRRMIRAWCSAFDCPEPVLEVRPEIFS
jgi:hypothetical protein